MISKNFIKNDNQNLRKIKVKIIVSLINIKK